MDDDIASCIKQHGYLHVLERIADFLDEDGYKPAALTLRSTIIAHKEVLTRDYYATTDDGE